MALVVATTAAVAAVITPANGPFTGCLANATSKAAKTTKGTVYNVAAGYSSLSACATGDTVISFSNGAGPQGEPGPSGAPGEPGAGAAAAFEASVSSDDDDNQGLVELFAAGDLSFSLGCQYVPGSALQYVYGQATITGGGKLTGDAHYTHDALTTGDQGVLRYSDSGTFTGFWFYVANTAPHIQKITGTVLASDGERVFTIAYDATGDTATRTCSIWGTHQVSALPGS